jgi:hypothetical protein
MTSPVTEICRECKRPRAPGALFCECGALLEYSASGNERVSGKPKATDDTRSPEDFEGPPGPYQPMGRPAAVSTTAPLRVVRCPNEKCRALNPTSLLFCWRCGTVMAQGVEARPPWSLRRVLRLEKPPLSAGQRERQHKPFLGKNPVALLRIGLTGLVVALVVSALAIGLIKAWDPTRDRVVNWYAAAREALFPRFRPESPSSVVYTNAYYKQNPKHPVLAAFDRDLSTYWQSVTPRKEWDKLTVHFKPAPKEINEVNVFAGDPTSTTIVPRELQMTFYRWQPGHGLPCHFPVRCQGRWGVEGTPMLITLVNTPTEQRFSTGTRTNIGQIVITVRGVHPTANPKSQAALTDVEFFDKH